MTQLQPAGFITTSVQQADYWISITACQEVCVPSLQQLDNLVLESCFGWHCVRHLQVGKKMLIPPTEWGWVVQSFDADLWEVMPPGTHETVKWFEKWHTAIASPQTDWSKPPERVPRCSQDVRGTMKLLHHLETEYHGDIKTPFEPGATYFAGFTPHGASGFNGVPDYYAAGDTLEVAVCRAGLLTKGLAVILQL